MKLKNMVLIGVILMIVVSSLNLVSAGWFDSGNSDNKADDRQFFMADIIDSNITFDRDDAAKANVQGDGTIEMSNMTSYEGYFVANLTELSDDDVKVIETKLKNSNGFNMTLYYSSGAWGTEVQDFDYTLNNRTLNITFSGTDEDEDFGRWFDQAAIFVDGMELSLYP